MSNRDLCIMACVFCRDPQFHQWAGEKEYGAGMRLSEQGAKEYILHLCQVSTRNDLDTNQDAAQRFHDLVRKPFLEWKENQATAPAGR